MSETAFASISKEALIRINKKFTSRGITGVENEAELERIVSKVLNTRGINRKAATLLMKLSRRHPFVDGNKRTAYEAATTLLELNGKKLKKLKVGGRWFFRSVFAWAIEPKTTIDEIVDWIANHTRK